MTLALLEILYDAARSSCGLVVETDNVQLLRQRFYAERRSADDPSLEQLAFIISPINGLDLWIVNKGNADAEG